MKKNYIMGVIACAALTMTSCSNDEIGEKNSQQQIPIEFGVYLGRDAQNSRGSELTTDNLTKFGVLAYYSPEESSPDFMYNQAVTKNGTSWTYSPLKYWPTTQGHPLIFHAYAPHTDDDANNQITLCSNTQSGLPQFTISIPSTNLTNMVDFIACSRTISNSPTIKTVEFTFKHEMTRIGLKAKVNKAVYGSDAANKTKVVIRSIQLNKGGDFFTKATYTFPQESLLPGYSVDSKWDKQEGEANLNLQSILNWSSDWTINGTDTKVISGNNKGIVLEGETAVNLLKTDNEKQQYLFLIPAKDSSKGTKVNSTKATIKYDIITEDANLKDGYSITSAEKIVALPEGIMKKGQAYNLTFTINVDDVELSATTDAWKDTTKDVDVEYTDKDTY